MSALDDIEAAAGALNALTVQEAAEKARIDAAVQAALQATVAPAKTIYLDAVAGLDTNDGTTPARAVKTPQQACVLVGAGQQAFIVCCSDVVIAQAITINGIVTFQSDTSNPDAGVVVPHRMITIAAGAWSGKAGDFVIGILPMRFLSLYNIDLHVGPITGESGVIGGDHIVFANCTISWDPGFASNLVYHANAADVAFLGSTSLPSGYAGHVFFGVAAGQNPNGPLLRTNLLSA